MKVLVIGATGHIGTWLVPRLVTQGLEVIAVSRGSRQPYYRASEWDHVDGVHVDREQEEQAGSFGARIAALEADVEGPCCGGLRRRARRRWMISW